MHLNSAVGGKLPITMYSAKSFLLTFQHETQGRQASRGFLSKLWLLAREKRRKQFQIFAI